MNIVACLMHVTGAGISQSSVQLGMAPAVQQSCQRLAEGEYASAAEGECAAGGVRHSAAE